MGLTLTIGSLFSGIGGLELGLERAGLGPVVWQCEIDPFCRSVLEKHWPSVERFQDVTRLANPPTVDLICGGFPCQDVSSAGKGAGLAGERSGLWYQFARLIGESQPEWVVVENVASGARRWVDQVIVVLEKLGYEALPIPLSAQDVGAFHLRRRVFIVAHAKRYTVRQQPRRGRGPSREGPSQPRIDGEAGLDPDTGCQLERESNEEAAALGVTWPWANTLGHGWWQFEPCLDRLVDGAPIDMDPYWSALGNAVVPQCAEVIGWVIRELTAESSPSPPARGK